MRSSVVISTLAFLLLLASPAFANSITNGDFSSGLNGWEAFGSTWVDNEEAVLDDVQDFFGVLTQGVFVGAGTHELSFDYYLDLSSEYLDDGYDLFADSFTANLDLADAPDLFSASTVDSLNLIYMEGGLGGSILIGSPSPFALATFGPSDKGPGWSTYHIVFEAVLDYAIIDFQFADGNWVDGDSQIRIDNVVLNTNIPEPSTMMLSLIGLIGLAARRRVEA